MNGKNHVLVLMSKREVNVHGNQGVNRKRRANKNMTKKDNDTLTDEELEELIEEATTDCYDEYESRVGFLTMIQDNVTVPFSAILNGDVVSVSEVDGNDRVIKATIKQDGKSYPVDILDLKIDDSVVEGSKWIAAYRKWEGR